MVKNILTSVALMAFSTLFLGAQAQSLNTVIGTRSAENQGDKLLTMEEVILSRKVHPENKNFLWVPETSDYARVEKDALIQSSIKARVADRVLITLEQMNNILAKSGLFKTESENNLLRTLPRVSFKNQNTITFAALSHYFELDLENQKLNIALPLASRAQNFTPSGKGTFAFTRENNLFMVDAQGNETQITNDTDKNIVNGQSVSRNEFGIMGGIFWSQDASQIAFYSKDESKVSEFPLIDITQRVAANAPIKYPMAGMASEHVRLGIYNIAEGKTIFLNVTDFDEERYLTNITWSPKGDRIFIQVLNRAQKHMKLNMYDAQTGELVKTILEEQNDRFVEPQDNIVFLKSSKKSAVNGYDTQRFIYRTDNRDGFKNLYIVNVETSEIERLTKTDADVQYLTQDSKFIYYSSAELSPVDNHIFKVAIKNGKVTRLTFEEGWHTASFNSTHEFFVDNYNSVDVPRVIQVRSTSHTKFAKELFRAEDPLKDYNCGEVELGSVKSADGKFNNYYRLIKPANFDENKKYPTIVYVYGGPHSQLVKNTWMASLGMWEMYMAQKGYVVYIQDNRGTLNQGAEFEKAIHANCGQAEMADQMMGVEFLKSLPYVDADRIGVHGWSYGGFMTISLITNHPDVFKVAVAGGPVIDWKWYEIMYGERYMDSPLTNADGYEKVSLINKAKDLKGKLLICQGVIDPVVVWQHSLSFVRECIMNNVQVDYFPYPRHEHNVRGKDRIHLMDKVTMYFEDYL